MSYYTRFEFSALSPDDGRNLTGKFLKLVKDALEFSNKSPDEIQNYREEYVKEMTQVSKAIKNVDENILYHLETDDAVKWYDCETDMKKLSISFPDYIFILEGEGEEPGDIWRKGFFRGKVQGGKAVIKLPEIDLKNWK